MLAKIAVLEGFRSELEEKAAKYRSRAVELGVALPSTSPAADAKSAG